MRAALAIDNARLYENLGSVARALQQGLLPQRLPTLAGMDLAARYRPAGDGSLIGGDFYDVLPRAGGLDLVIGDVTGKGARAAALTAQVRHTLRTAARYEATPSGVLDVVNRTLLGERAEPAATAPWPCAGSSSTGRPERRSAAPGTRCRWSCAAPGRSSMSAGRARCSGGSPIRACWM